MSTAEVDTRANNRSEYLLVTKTEDLQKYCTKFRKEDFVTVDTEFMRDGTYWPRLCLIQIGGKEDTILIDSCAEGLSLKPFGELLADKNVKKVFHAAQQDVEICFKEFGVMPVNLFDTQIAARVLGFGEQIGYSALTEALTNVPIPKDERFTDWSRRPLTDAQLKYAANDVIYLRDVFKDIFTKLQERGRLAWVEKDIEDSFKAERFTIDPMSMWHKVKVRTHSRLVLGRLQHLAAWRENEAMQSDTARVRILRDDLLAQIAIVGPKTLEGLESIRGVKSAWARGKHGQQIVDLMCRVEKMDKDSFPKIEKRPHSVLTPYQETQIALLKVILVERAHREDLVPRLIASNDDLRRLVQGERELPVLKGWKADLFGKDALGILEGKLAVRLTDSNVICCETKAE